VVCNAGAGMMDICTFLISPESKTLEFKRDLSSPKPILKTLEGVL